MHAPLRSLVLCLGALLLAACAGIGPRPLWPEPAQQRAVFHAPRLMASPEKAVTAIRDLAPVLRAGEQARPLASLDVDTDRLLLDYSEQETVYERRRVYTGFGYSPFCLNSLSPTCPYDYVNERRRIWVERHAAAAFADLRGIALARAPDRKSVV